MIEEKQFLLDEVKEQIKAHPSFVIMRYTGLTAAKAEDFRRQMNKRGGKFGVMRKRILLKAAQAAGIELDSVDLGGHIGVVYSAGEATEVAKGVYQFGQDTKTVEIAGGYIDGRVCQAEEVVMISQLPGKDEMRAQLLGLFEAPMAQTLAVVDALLTSVMHCMDNKCKAEGETSESDESANGEA